MLLVKRILLHPLVPLEIFEYDLTEAVVICNVRHLGIVKLGRQFPCLQRIVNLPA